MTQLIFSLLLRGRYWAQLPGTPFSYCKKNGPWEPVAVIQRCYCLQQIKEKLRSKRRRSKDELRWTRSAGEKGLQPIKPYNFPQKWWWLWWGRGGGGVALSPRSGTAVGDSTSYLFEAKLSSKTDFICHHIHNIWFIKCVTRNKSFLIIALHEILITFDKG